MPECSSSNPSRILRRLSWQTAGDCLLGVLEFEGTGEWDVGSGWTCSCWDLRNTRLV